MTIRIDYTNMMAGAVSGGLAPEVWAEAAAAFAGARGVFTERRARGELGFIDLALDGSGIADLLSFADGAGQAFSDVVVLGIGGSALGPIALRSALRSTSWNALDDEAREYFPRLHVLENVDPVTVASVLGRVELGRTLFLVISKSGGTAETMAQYLIARGRLEAELGKEFKRHLVFLTDPARGALREIARNEGIAALEIPSNVGGRFSILSPVGLLPAALIGIDVRALLAGAADMFSRCDGDELASNPAAVFGTLQWMADSRLGLRNHIIMPYSDPLRDFGGWFVQLWAESLGKIKSDGTSVGPTPIPALGVTDQHSQVQLFMEGPRDKTVTFVAVGERAVDLEIPKLHGDIPELSYLGGHTLAELLDAERRATAAALSQRGRLNMTITLDSIDAHHVGGLIMLFEMATIYAGALYGINPLDQPGVELGKRYTYALMGRPDAVDARREWDAIPEPEQRWGV
ncbi:MAG: glucose-6-phosphate isomerase [Gemmatimonadaceae bacterium]|nr:glucose-6-phosphate isomerase [Gemmatimonadaceae bacterium]MDQ3519141.1 glucose-6-phosphate isomerase [Gemmatimonadota bacterium]